MKKVDIPCFLLALFLSCLLLYFLSYDYHSLEAEPLKIGLVAVENNNALESDGQSKTDASPQEETQKNTSEEQKTQEETPLEEEKTIEENSKKPEEEADVGIKKPSLEELKKSIAKPKLDKQEVNMQQFEKKNANSGIGIDVDKILSRAGEHNGLPSGSRMGVIDGSALIQWSASNQEPIFPEVAKKTGKNGSVVLVIMVNEAGDVISVKMERGSGVPEINTAIEKVARTWKVKLLKKGKSVGGSFVLKYSFHLE